MATMPGPHFPFSARQAVNGQDWGIWDNRHGGWAREPRYRERAAQTLCEAMVEAYAAGSSDTLITEAR